MPETSPGDIEASPDDNDRLGILLLHRDLLLDLLCFPKDVELLDVYINPNENRGVLRLKIRHHTFRSVAHGALIPEVTASFSAIYWNNREEAPERGKVAKFDGFRSYDLV